MAVSLETNVKVSADWVYRDTLSNGLILQDASRTAYDKNLASGVAVDQNDVKWLGSGSLAATTNLDLDLAGGLTQSLFGSTVTYTLAKLKLLLLIITSTTSGDKLLVGPNASGTPLANHILTPWNDVTTAVNVAGADSPLVLASKKDGFAVTAGTGDLLRLRNPGASAVGYQLLLIGTSS